MKNQADSQSDKALFHENMTNTARRNAKFGTNLGKYVGIPNLFSEFKNVDFQLHNKQNAAE